MLELFSLAGSVDVTVSFEVFHNASKTRVRCSREHLGGTLFTSRVAVPLHLHDVVIDDRANGPLLHVHSLASLSNVVGKFVERHTPILGPR